MTKSDASLGPCEFCGANMDIVGKAHVCRPNRARPGPRPTTLEDIPHGDDDPQRLADMVAAEVDDRPRDCKGRLIRRKGPGAPRASTKTIDVPAGPDATRQVVVQTLRRKAKNMALPDPHPDCRRCEEQARRARDRMRVRRGGS
jgi:hypothetical protein